ncbi:major facilitator superfamily domain-containing protein 4A-like isoform X2 [Haliotis rufescens]|uniref:major facilitator superfamily domain-containing protein 4A-like isoform X2 n=1 Tax=Haliotis rufescens TaxID=6454 RepID=UPI00201EAA68|nr:major facilitator superfamily domain-containing protein 4A-like isoform X2 [Haliotis rufescens]
MDGTDEKWGETDNSLNHSASVDGAKWITHSEQTTLGKEEKVSFWRLFMDNRLQVVTYCLVFGSFGVCVGFLGPTVFDLGCQTNSDLKEMNWVFFVQLLMTLVGSITSGCMADRVQNNILLLVGAAGVSFSMVLIPACDTLGGLIVVLMIMGWCMGCIDTIANLRMITLFGKNVGPFLQAMHCCYGLGAFVSPMIASAFLLNMDCTPFVDGYTVEPHTAIEKKENVSVEIPPQPRKVFRYRNMSHVPIAFYILGGLQLLVALEVALVILRERMRGPVKSPVGQQTTHSGEGVASEGGMAWVRKCCACSPRDVFLITLLASISVFLFDGLQSTYANYIYTYAHEASVKSLQKFEGAILDACFWGMFALGRLLSVPAAAKLTPSFMLLFSIVGCSLALVFTLIFRFNHVSIYVGTIFVGLFVSSMSPSALSLTEQFIDMNSSITTCLVVMAALGEALCPIIVGNLVVSLGATSFLAFCFSIVLVTLLLYWALYMAGKQMGKYQASPRSFVWLSSNPVAAAGESTLIDPSSVKYYSRMPESDSNVEMAAIEPHQPNNTEHQQPYES